MDKDSKIYISGHTGLVGSAIKRLLLAKGYNNLIFRTSKELDLRYQASVEDFFKSEKPEYVFNAAARVGGIIANKEKKAEFIYNNLQIQSNIIHFSYKYGVKKLLFFGSNCMYPKDCPQPIKEECFLTGAPEPTNDAYSIAKIAGVKMCQSYNEQYKTNFICVVPASLFGANDNFDLMDSHFVPALIRKFYEAKIRGDKKIILWGTGKPRREIIYVDNLAEACIFLMDNYNSSELINIGMGEDFEIREIAEILKEITGFEGEIEYDTGKPDGVMRKLLDSGRINSLGWRPKIDTIDGLRKTYEWFQENSSCLLSI